MDGCKLYPGEDTTPVLLNITYSLSKDQEAIDIQKHFRKNTTVGEMKVCRTPVYIGDDFLYAHDLPYGQCFEN